MKNQNNTICLCDECRKKQIQLLNEYSKLRSAINKGEVSEGRTVGSWDNFDIEPDVISRDNDSRVIQNLINLNNKNIISIKRHNIENLVDIHDKLLVKYDDFDEIDEIELVCYALDSSFQNKVSLVSPVGRAIYKKEIGGTYEFTVGNNKRHITVLEKVKELSR